MDTGLGARRTQGGLTPRALVPEIVLLDNHCRRDLAHLHLEQAHHPPLQRTLMLSLSVISDGTVRAISMTAASAMAGVQPQNGQLEPLAAALDSVRPPFSTLLQEFALSPFSGALQTAA